MVWVRFNFSGNLLLFIRNVISWRDFLLGGSTVYIWYLEFSNEVLKKINWKFISNCRCGCCEWFGGFMMSFGIIFKWTLDYALYMTEAIRKSQVSWYWVHCGKIHFFANKNEITCERFHIFMTLFCLKIWNGRWNKPAPHISGHTSSIYQFKNGQWTYVYKSIQNSCLRRTLLSHQ